MHNHNNVREFSHSDLSETKWHITFPPLKVSTFQAFSKFFQVKKKMLLEKYLDFFFKMTRKNFQSHDNGDHVNEEQQNKQDTVDNFGSGIRFL